MPFFRINGTLMHVRLSGRKDRQAKPCVATIDRCHSQKQGEYDRMRCCMSEGHAGEHNYVLAEGMSTQVQCRAFSTCLCDWPLDNGKTCDAPLCDAHSHAHPKKDDVDYCLPHWKAYRESDPELF